MVDSGPWRWRFSHCGVARLIRVLEVASRRTGIGSRRLECECAILLLVEAGFERLDESLEIRFFQEFFAASFDGFVDASGLVFLIDLGEGQEGAEQSNRRLLSCIDEDWPGEGMREGLTNHSGNSRALSLVIF